MKNTLFILALLISTSLSFGQSTEYKKMLNQYYNGFTTMSIADVLKHVKAKDAYLIDVREKNEFNVSHIENATRVTPGSTSIKQFKDVDKSTLIIVYCSVGARSQTYGELLLKKGFTNVVNMYGGMFHWANSGYPMIDPEGKSTQKIHGYNKEWGKWVTKGTVVY